MYIPKLLGFLYPNHARWKGNYNKPYTSIHQKLGSIYVLTQTEAKLRLEGPRAEIEIWQPMPCWPIFGTSVLGATCMLVCWGWFGLDSHLPHFFVGADDLLTENFTLQRTAFSRRAPEFERNFYVMPFREAWHGIFQHLSSDKTARHCTFAYIRHWQRCLKSWLPAAGWCYTVARPRSLWFHTAQLFCQKVCRFLFTEIQCMRCITIFSISCMNCMNSFQPCPCPPLAGFCTCQPAEVGHC